MCDNPDLLNGEPLFGQGGHLHKISEIAFDGRLGVIGFSFYVREGIAFEIEFDDLGLVTDAGSHIQLLSPGHDEQSLFFE